MTGQQKKKNKHIFSGDSVLNSWLFLFLTGDDCVSIQTGCSNIHVHHINCGPGHGIRYVVVIVILSLNFKLGIF